jgi:hypothetical protein
MLYPHFLKKDLTMSTELHQEIDYLKALAQDGGRAPIMNGAALFWAGIVFSCAAIVHYGMVEGILPNPNPWFIWINWGVASLIYGVLAFISIRLSIQKYGMGTLMNRTIGNVWSSIGFAIFVMFVALIIASIRFETMEDTARLFSPLILILYGVGWLVVSAVSGHKWLFWIGLMSFALAPLLSSLDFSAQMLAYALALTLVATLPGLILMRSHKA